MAYIDEVTPGSFCWMELGTTDQAAAKQFYSALFGWTANDFPMGLSELYTIFQLDRRDAAAAFTLRQDMLDRGVPPHWMLYIATWDADRDTARAVELGATVTAGPFDVGESGRMSVIKDPNGSHFCVWQANQSVGIGIANVPGAFCWADLNALDRDKAKQFYSNLFNWSLVPGAEGEAGYLHIQNGETMIGGMPSAQQLPPGLTPHWSIYFQVADCDASAAKVVELGGKVFRPPMTIEGTGRFAVVVDPQGATFLLFQLLPR